MRTRIKICGISRSQDAEYAASLGVDALGFVFYPSSPRAVTARQALEIGAGLPSFVNRVALFLDPEPSEVEAVIETLRPELLQFHGGETADFCRRFALPYIKAVPMGDGVDLLRWAQDYGDARALLLDSHRLGEAGGSGRSFDWDVVQHFDRPIILAGGLRPDNVAEAIARVRPYAVDVSSGVEESPGIKDHAAMTAFVKAIKDVDARD